MQDLVKITDRSEGMEMHRHVAKTSCSLFSSRENRSVNSGHANSAPASWVHADTEKTARDEMKDELTQTKRRI